MYLYAYIMGIRDLAVTVDIPGVGTVNAENAAQDSTLNAILGAINAQSKSGGGGSASGSGFDAANRKAQQAAGGLGVLGGAASNTGDAMANAGQSASNAGNAFASASTNVIASFGALAGQTTSTSGMLGAVGAGISKMGAVISKLGDSAGFVGRALGGVAVAASGAFGLLLGVVSRNVEQFEKISAAGGSFGNSLMQFREISNSAGLSTEMMANIAMKAGSELSAFGGTTAAGAKIFAKNNKSMQDEYGGQMMRMGIGFEQQGVMLAQFMGDLASTGQNMDQLDTGELNKSFMTLTTQQKLMAQYNGTTLEAEREKQKALKKDAQLQAALLDLPPMQRKAAMEAIAAAESQVAGSGQAIKEMFLTGGDTFTAESSALMAEIPGYSEGLKNMVRGIKNGNLEYADNLKAAGATITKEQLSGIADIVKAGAMGASSPMITGLTNAFSSIEATINKEVNNALGKGQDDAASLKKAPSKLDDNAVQLAKTALKMSVAMDGAVSGMLGSDGFNFALKGANAALNGMADLTKEATDKLNPKKTDVQKVDIVKNTIGLMSSGEGVVDRVKGFFGFGSKPADVESGDPAKPVEKPAPIAVPADPSSRSTVSRDTLPDVTNTQATLDAASADTLSADSQSALTSAQAIPDDVADAMKTTPGLIQELTKQVKQSSEDNAKVVQQAIMNQ
jgi:hypothetical protein